MTSHSLMRESVRVKHMRVVNYFLIIKQLHCFITRSLPARSGGYFYPPFFIKFSNLVYYSVPKI